MGKYFYLNAQNEQNGPVEVGKLKSLGVTENTLVWSQGMPQWAPAGEVEELKELFVPVQEEVPTPPPTPAPKPQPSPSPAPVSQPVVSSPSGQPAVPSAGTAYSKVERTPAAHPGTPAPSLNGKPENNMIWAVLSTLFCCLTTGIYAIICASQVDGLYSRGDYYGAQSKANSARTWSIVGAVGAFIIGIIYTLIYVVAFAAAGLGGLSDLNF